MLRILPFVAAAALALPLAAQQLALSWATPLPAQNQRVHVLSTGDVATFGTAGEVAVLQRLDAAGTVTWTVALPATGARAVDMDIDAADNLYVSLYFTAGQLDLDPGANETVVEAGRVYAKYNASGVLQWGFSLVGADATSDDGSGISVTDAGDLYLCGDLGTGTYDLDPLGAPDERTVSTDARGSLVARYTTEGVLVWADLQSWPGGNSMARDIAAMDDGSGFYVVRKLDTDGPVSGQVDVDPGPNVFNTAHNEQGILRFDADLHFQAHMYNNYIDLRLAADDAGALYVLGYYINGCIGGKYTTSGTAFNTVYSNDLPDFNNLRIGDVVPDNEGGCLGMYNLNCTASTVRFYKLDASGALAFNFMLTSGTDCTLPVANGFDFRGGFLYVGSTNDNYPIDFEPGEAELLLPTGTDHGVVARYAWCTAQPMPPGLIYLMGSGTLCTGMPLTAIVTDPVEGLRYDWSAPPTWTLLGEQGGPTMELIANEAGEGTLIVAAFNACGAATSLGEFTFRPGTTVDLGADLTICPGASVALTGGDPSLAHLWMPGGEITSTITATPVGTTTYSVEVNNDGCTARDTVVVTVDLCTGIAEPARPALRAWPVPVHAGQPLRVEGLAGRGVLGITGADGRAWPVRAARQGDALLLDVQALPPGMYALRLSGDAAVRVVVE